MGCSDDDAEFYSCNSRDELPEAPGFPYPPADEATSTSTNSFGPLVAMLNDELRAITADTSKFAAEVRADFSYQLTCTSSSIEAQIASLSSKMDRIEQGTPNPNVPTSSATSSSRYRRLRNAGTKQRLWTAAFGEPPHAPDGHVVGPSSPSCTPSLPAATAAAAFCGNAPTLGIAPPSESHSSVDLKHAANYKKKMRPPRRVRLAMRSTKEDSAIRPSEDNTNTVPREKTREVDSTNETPGQGTIPRPHAHPTHSTVVPPEEPPRVEWRPQVRQSGPRPVSSWRARRHQTAKQPSPWAEINCRVRPTRAAPLHD